LIDEGESGATAELDSTNIMTGFHYPDCPFLRFAAPQIYQTARGMIMRADKRRRLICAGESHQGLVRDNNEDLFYCDSEGGIFIVIDGVGGHRAGERAAEIALKILCSRLEGSAGAAEERLREAITLANNEIYKQSQVNEAWSGMSCVLTASVVEGDKVTVGHVGDTKLYKIQPGRITQLTRDHSFVGELVAGGFINEEEAMEHPRRNEITRNVGSNPRQPGDPDFIEIGIHPFQPDSALLLCSDGLSDLVAPEQILSIVMGFFYSPSKVVNSLIDAANAAGGKDNVTVVYVVAASAGAAT
jgi:PPM family protein phosphatase